MSHRWLWRGITLAAPCLAPSLSLTSLIPRQPHRSPQEPEPAVRASCRCTPSAAHATPEHAPGRPPPRAHATPPHAPISAPCHPSSSAASRTAPTASYRAPATPPRTASMVSRAQLFIARPSLATSTLHPSFPHSPHHLSYTARNPEPQPRSCCCPWFFSALRRTEVEEDHSSAMLPSSFPLSGLHSHPR